MNKLAAYETWMVEALREGVLAQGLSSPNPPVGAVVIRDNVVVGRGHTQRPGGAHAEIMALREAGDAARGALLVCTLEPCAHTGRTGPCADAIITAGISAVAYAVAEPTDQAGGGHQRLAEAGIAVTAGVSSDDAEGGALRGWLHHQRTGRPYVIWKVAQSLDGQIAASDGSSRWITGPQSRAAVHDLRERVDAILVGAGTVRIDDAALSARDEHGGLRGRQPLRIVVTGSGQLPQHAKILDGQIPTLIALGPAAAHHRVDVLRQRSIDHHNNGRAACDLWLSPGDLHEGVDLYALLTELGRRGILTVLVEGGPSVAGTFAAADLIDEVQTYLAPKLLVSGMWPALRGYGVSSIDDALNLQIADVTRSGDDVLVRAVRRHVPPRGK
ncbi:MAG: bifunctional diaminohydroxyphosphoribosylaminopyrimidine deaminase/5-amino-6-(5-phosphoribosylamino)uracil reductase RibD [Cumulibacter sp.]